MLDRREGGTEIVGGVQKWVINCNWKFPAEQFASDQYHALFSHASAVQVLGAKDDGSDKRSVMDKPPARCGKPPKMRCNLVRTVTVAVSSLLKNRMLMSGRWRSFKLLPRNLCRSRTTLGEVRALRLAGHNNIFPTLSWLNGTATLRVWHPRGPDQVEVWAFCITDKAASDEVKAAFENSATRAFGPAGFLEQDDSETGVKSRNCLKATAPATANCVWKWGLVRKSAATTAFLALLTISFQKLPLVECTNAGPIF